jgi:formate dehydrogenase major subunit
MIGANPTDAHPVFASRMKNGCAGREAHRHRSAPHRSGPHAARRSRVSPAAPCPAPMSRCSRAGACDRDRGSGQRGVRARTLRLGGIPGLGRFRFARAQQPGGGGKGDRRPGRVIRAAARLYATGGNAAIYYGLGVTEHSQGSTTVMAIANLAMATGNIGRPGVGVNPLRGQNNVQGSCDMGSFPHELSGYRHISDDATRAMFEALWGVTLDPSRACAFPNMLDAAVDGTFKGLYIQGEDILQSDPDTTMCGGPRGDGMRRGAGSVPERDRELRACVPAGVDLPGKGRNLHQRRAPHPARAQGDGTEGRLCRLGDHAARSPKAMGYPMHYNHPSRSWTRSRALTPTFAGVSFEKLAELGSVQWPCNDKAPEGTPVMHIERLRARQGQVRRSPNMSRPTSGPGRVSRCC